MSIFARTALNNKLCNISCVPSTASLADIAARAAGAKEASVVPAEEANTDPWTVASGPWKSALLTYFKGEFIKEFPQIEKRLTDKEHENEVILQFFEWNYSRWICFRGELIKEFT